MAAEFAGVAQEAPTTMAVAGRIYNKNHDQYNAGSSTLRVPSLDPLLVCIVRGVKKLRLCGFEF